MEVVIGITYSSVAKSTDLLCHRSGLGSVVPSGIPACTRTDAWKKRCWFFVFVFCSVFVSACFYVHHVCLGRSEGVGSPESRVIVVVSHHLGTGNWELKWDPLQEQQVPLTIEPSCQLLKSLQE